MKTVKVKVTARTPGRAGKHALGTHKKPGVFFPHGQPVELEVTAEHLMKEDEFGNQVHKLRSQLSILQADPHLVVEMLKSPEDLEAEARELRKAAAGKGKPAE